MIIFFLIVRLKETDDELSQSKIELDVLRKRDKLAAVKIRDNEEPGTVHMMIDGECSYCIIKPRPLILYLL